MAISQTPHINTSSVTSYKVRAHNTRLGDFISLKIAVHITYVQFSFRDKVATSKGIFLGPNIVINIFIHEPILRFQKQELFISDVIF